MSYTSQRAVNAPQTINHNQIIGDLQQSMQFVPRSAAKYRDYLITLRNKEQFVAKKMQVVQKTFPEASGFRERKLATLV